MTRWSASKLPYAGVVVLGALLGALLEGCPSTGVVCSAGLSPCGIGCADFQSDKFNCGSCGATCQQTQVCVAGACRCQTGALSCGGQCSVPQTDPRNCGGCAGAGGVACAAGEVCEQGLCKPACTLGTSVLCGQSCTDLHKDPNNCGACGHACNSGESCHPDPMTDGGDCTYDLLAACGTKGEVVGLQSGPDLLGPLHPFGSQPQALASLSGVLLSADQMDAKLYEGRLWDLGLLPEAPAVGHAANQVLVDDPYVYVINSVDNTLQVLQRQGVPLDAGQSDAGSSDSGLPADSGSADSGNPDGGMRHGSPTPDDWTADAGLGLVTVAELNLGANTSPEWAAKLGTDLYVTLYGGFGPAAAAGQKVLRIDVSHPLTPAVADTFDLSALPLSPYDGGVAIARPQAIIAHNGLLYAVLNNLGTDYLAVGPGLLARIDPVAHTTSLVGLGGGCQNPVALIADVNNLYVVCGGLLQLDSSFNLLGNSHAGVVVVSAPPDAGETFVTGWNVSCPAEDAGCAVPLPFNIAQVGNRLYIGDAEAGRIFALDVVGNQLVERRGYTVDGGLPIQACPVSPPTAFSNVSGLLAP